MNMMNTDAYKGPVRPGDKVTVHYIGKLEDGFVFDSTEEKLPIEFIVGSGEVIKGLSDGVIGMMKDEMKTIEVDPDESYGEFDQEKVAEIAVSNLPQNANLEVGESFSLEMHDGSAVEAVIMQVNKDSVVINANHPLAGQKLIFDIGLVDIESVESLTGKTRVW